MADMSQKLEMLSKLVYECAYGICACRICVGCLHAEFLLVGTSTPVLSSSWGCRYMLSRCSSSKYISVKRYPYFPLVNDNTDNANTDQAHTIADFNEYRQANVLRSRVLTIKLCYTHHAWI